MPNVDVKPGSRLHDLLELRGNTDGVADVRRLAALRGGVDGSLLGKAIADWTPERLNADLEKAFAVDPFALMARAWSQIAKVRDAIKKSLGPPPVAASVPLLKHDIDAKLRPRLVLSVEGVDWCDGGPPKRRHQEAALRGETKVRSLAVALVRFPVCASAVDLPFKNLAE